MTRDSEKPRSSRAELTELLFGAAQFQLLHAACELGLFEALHVDPDASLPVLRERLRLQERPASILLMGTTALGLTERRSGPDRSALFRNAPVVQGMFDDGFWTIFAELVRFQSKLAYQPAAHLVESLREDKNLGLTCLPGPGTDLYTRLTAHPELEQAFFTGMRAWSSLSNPALVAGARLEGAQRVLDVGGGDAVNSIALAKANPHLYFTVLDRASALEIARARIAEAGLSHRITTYEADLFESRFPEGHDVVLFANQLLIWSDSQNSSLLEKAYHCLPDGGRVLVFSVMANELETGPLYAALDNVYFACLTASQSRIRGWRTYADWLARAGFTDANLFENPGWTPHAVVTAYKPIRATVEWR